MSPKNWIAVALLATAAISSSASADNRGINTAVGAVVGAVIGNTVGGQEGAVMGGVLGAVVGATASSGHDERRYAPRRSSYGHRGPVYYQPAPRGHAYGYQARRYHDVRRVEYMRYGHGYHRR